AGRYHYSAFSSPNPFMSDDEISPAPPAESPAAAPDETQSGDAAEPPEDGHDAADQVPPEHDGQGAEKSNVFGYEEGWYQKGLEEERRRKEEAEAKERNEVPCITLAELEEIRKGAYDDGFAEGKKEGFAKGHEDGLASGHGEGLKSGHDEGYQAGIADGAAAVDAEKAKFAALAEKLGKPLELVNESIEKELLVVVSRIARAFLEKEARVPEFLAKSLHAAVAALPSTKEGVTVMLNPADAAELLKLMPEESLSDLGWKVVSDASVGAGDIRIDSGSSSVDWKLSERIDAVIERFVNENSGGNG
ncbi:MAG: FliH/SctL family protein, partial [Succinivibrionaceae bacterium]|nr:FliH/SctL family protein [Succinivibrionaceae bacterium]